MIHPSVRTQRDADAHRLLTGQARNLAAERQLVRRDGSTIWARVKKTAIEHRGEPVIMVTIEDWSEHRSTLQELTFIAHHDALTGLSNRTRLRRYLHDLGPERDALLVAMIDVVIVAAAEDGGIEHRIQRPVGRPAVLAGVGSFLPSVSVGSAVLAPRTHLASALRQADKSMYRNKRLARRSRDRRR